MARSHFIYALAEPGSDDYRYVGASRQPKRRLHYHCTQSNRCPRLQSWLSGLRARGLAPRLVILREVAASEFWRDAERDTIKSLIAAGYDLVNVHGAIPRDDRCRVAVEAAIADGERDGPCLLRVLLETTNTTELARDIGVSRVFIFYVLNGIRVPSEKLVCALERFGVPRNSWERIAGTGRHYPRKKTEAA